MPTADSETPVSGDGATLLRITYIAICVLLVGGFVIATKSAMFLARNAKNSKSTVTVLDSYKPWPKEVREEFRHLLLQNNGRVKPAHTFARFTLLLLNNSSSVRFETKDGERHRLAADEWLLDVLFRPQIAKDLPFFNVDDTDAIQELGVSPKEGRSDHHKRDRYSYNQLVVAREKFAQEGQRLAKKSENYQRSEKDPQYELSRIEGITMRLGQNMSFFEFLSNQFGFAQPSETLADVSFLPESMREMAVNFEVVGLMERMPEMSLQQLGEYIQSEPQNEEDRTVQEAFRLYYFVASSSRNLQIVAPKEATHEEWYSPGDALLAGLGDKALRPWVSEQINQLTDICKNENAMWSAGDNKATEAMASGLRDYVKAQNEVALARKDARHAALATEIEATDNAFEKERLSTRQAALKVEGAKAGQEVSLYAGGPFGKSLVCFVLGFVVLAMSWLVPGSRFARITTGIAVTLLVVGLVYNIYGITMRSIIRSRPPITNLYDTVIFVTGVVVLLALFMEYFSRRGIGLLIAAISGAGGMFLSIRYEAKEATDTMDPLQAVLDTNLWLATHVTTINIGYAAGMLAAFLGAYYLLYRFLRPLGGMIRKKVAFGSDLFQEDKDTRDYARTISKMAYGIVCFCLFFSLIGTVLGGIWANYSWGRFWGWDPKENGALMICLWSLVILHLRLGGYVKDIGIAVLSIILGIIVTFSWWGVNNLGVGLHSYGFTDGVWPALYVSWAEAGFIMACALPLWLSAKLKESRPKAAEAA